MTINKLKVILQLISNNLFSKLIYHRYEVWKNLNLHHSESLSDYLKASVFIKTDCMAKAVYHYKKYSELKYLRHILRKNTKKDYKKYKKIYEEVNEEIKFIKRCKHIDRATSR